MRRVQWSCRLVALWIVCLLPPLGANAEEPRVLKITFDASVVTVEGVPREHRVIVFGVGIGAHGYSNLLTRDVETAVDDDGDGKVSFLIRRLAKRSVWIAVDATTGEYVVATPSGKAVGVLGFPSNAWRGDEAFVDVTSRYLEALVVRPGPRPSAWALRCSDGGSRDADGRSDRKVRLRLDRMERVLGEDKGPPRANPKDLLIAVDPQTLDFFISEAK